MPPVGFADNVIVVEVSTEVIVVAAGIPVPETGIAGASPVVTVPLEKVTTLDALAYAAFASVLRTCSFNGIFVCVVPAAEVKVPVRVALFLSAPVRFVRVKPMSVSIKLRLPSAFPEFSTAVNSMSSSAAS